MYNNPGPKRALILLSHFGNNLTLLISVIFVVIGAITVPNGDDDEGKNENNYCKFDLKQYLYSSSRSKCPKQARFWESIINEDKGQDRDLDRGARIVPG